ncbi:MAG: hypothetical protein WAK93_17530 [Solirubrobacteraceae bacterium]
MTTKRSIAAVAALIGAIGLIAVSSAGASTLIAFKCSHWKYFGGNERTHSCVSLHRRAHRHIVGHSWADVFYKTTSSSPRPRVDWHEDRSRHVFLCPNFSIGHSSETPQCYEALGYSSQTYRPGRCGRGERVDISALGLIGENQKHKTEASLVYHCSF